MKLNSVGRAAGGTLLLPVLVPANDDSGSLQPIQLQHFLSWLGHGNRFSIWRDREGVEPKTMQGGHKALIVEPDPYQIIRLLGRPSFQQDPLFVAAPLKSPKTCAHADGFGGIGEVADLERIA